MKITVVGLGYVGVVAATGLANVGHDVLAIDIDPDRIQTLKAGEVPIYEPGLQDWLTTALEKNSLRFKHRDDVDETLGDIALIATGTPPTRDGAADLRQVRSAIAWIKSMNPRDLIVVMKSTVPPGTGMRIAAQELAGAGIKYASNPEFLRAGKARQDWEHPDRIVIGAETNDREVLEALSEMHRGIEAPYMVTDITSAEMIKYASNAFLATRISFINEIASLCDLVGASIDQVSRGLAMDSRTGARIHAGVGYGGSCFPKDVRVLDHLGMINGANLNLLRSVINTNNQQRLLPLHALQKQFGDTLAGLTIGVLGLAFKPGTDDVRDAPSIDLIRILVDRGARVNTFDPQATRNASSRLPSSINFTDGIAQAAEGAHALVLMTEWNQIIQSNWKSVVEQMLPPKFIFDGRNALDPDKMQKLGFKYQGVGISARRGANGVSPLPEAPAKPLRSR